MKRTIFQTRKFEEKIDDFIEKGELSQEDFDDFKKSLVENPKLGKVITETGGARKIRLKTANSGKRGGFRVCYLDIEHKLHLFLIMIYPKNEKENLSSEEKKDLKRLISLIKGGKSV